ncbi:hypothetical protein H2200_011565 [Cladophialophora chaetospira]|uniref:DUF6594 domain-containing protein n=1 Tax=Cladophialophora chaetospira TaxID=386627 RepID=A0AA39CDC5_9EURO|nr:hypothetical protein H2200_011565 [Cladophialophora chaetospira]
MEGYAKIAAFMGEHPESAMVLRFSDISLQNILYLQAEIYGLLEDLRFIEKQNNASLAEDVGQFPLDWYTLAHTPEDGKENKQWATIKQLRPLLKEYNEAVLNFHEMSKLARPRSPDLQALQEWLRRPTLGGIYLTGRDRHIWAQGTDLTLVAAETSSNQFAIWLESTLVPIFHQTGALVRSCLLRKRSPRNRQVDAGIAEYSDAGVTRMANLVGAVLASLLPVIAIVVLHLVKSTGTRLGLIAVFSAVFSTTLWFLNDGKLIEVFSATSAFAAVQVVFIGTNG